MPQRPELPPDLPATVEEVVAAGRLARRGWWRWPGAADRDAVDHALEAVALTDLRRRRMHELSGGQQQRVLIAKALAGEPELLVLDEPIAGVDAESQRLFRDSLVHLAADHGAAVLLVSHELGAVAEDLDRVIVLKRTVLFDGTPPDLAARGREPRHPRRRPAALAGRCSGVMPWPFDRDVHAARARRRPRRRRVRAPDRAFLVQKRMSLMGDGLGHVAFAGVAAGLLLEVWPIWTALDRRRRRRGAHRVAADPRARVRRPRAGALLLRRHRARRRPREPRRRGAT